MAGLYSSRMSATRTLTYSYLASPTRLATLLRDPEFLRRRCEEAGETAVQVVVREQTNGFYASVERDKLVELPSFARHVVQPKNRIVDEYQWHSQHDRWHATYSIVISGVAAVVRGHSTLAPSAGGTSHVTSFEVHVRIPLLGAKLESLVADRTEQTFFEQAAANARALGAVAG